MRTGRPKRPLFDRFVEKLQLNPETGCWEWTGCKNPMGYGAFVVHHELTRGAHRVSYEWFIGPIPDGYDVHHTCKNRACVCPGHLNALPRSLHGVEHRMDQATCRHGHTLTEDNIIRYKTPSGKPRWRCRLCNNAQGKARLLKYRESVPRLPHPNAVKTHCKRGHEFTEANTHITTQGNRQCKTCLHMLQAQWREKRRKPKQTKTHCKHGHEYTKENTYIMAGRRRCKACHTESLLKYRNQKKRT